MALLLAAFLASPLAFAASPLDVRTDAIPVADLSADVAPADGRPDGWTYEIAKGRVTVTREPGAAGPVARLDYDAGTQGRLCAPPVPFPEGATAVLASRVSGDASLGDVTAVHLHLGDGTKVLHTGRRRIEKGAHPWEDVEIRATAPAGTKTAQACVEVRMADAKAPGTFRLAPFALSALHASSRAALPLRRVILVSVETFRRDHVSAYGYPRATTPYLDRLIAEGASFDRHYASAPYTHPSLAALVTGLLPTTLGFADNVPTLGPRTPNAAELFANAGYVTAGFNVQYVLSNRYGLNRGFHYYRNHPNDTPASVVTAELLPWLEAHANDNVFVWVHWFDPHGPYRPPAGFRERYVGDALWNADTRLLPMHPSANEGVAAIPKYVQDAGKTERRHYVAGYDGDVAAMDLELGKLVETIKSHGWAKDTLLAVTADHGESMTEHDRFFCHGSLWEHDIHVPMVVWSPGRVPAGARVEAPTSHVDVLPSLLDWAGLPVAGWLGDSMKGLLTRPRAPGALPFAVATLGRGANLRFAVRDTGPYKVLVDAKGALLDAWDLVKDPGETKSLAGLPPRDAVKLANAMKQWLATGKAAPLPSRPQALDDEDRERLRALGYIE